MHAKGTNDHTKSVCSFTRTPRTLIHIILEDCCFRSQHASTRSCFFTNNRNRNTDPSIESTALLSTLKVLLHFFHWIIVKEMIHFIIMLNNFINPTSFFWEAQWIATHFCFVNYFSTSHTEYGGEDFKRIKLFITNNSQTPPIFPRFKVTPYVYPRNSIPASLEYIPARHIWCECCNLRRSSSAVCHHIYRTPMCCGVRAGKRVSSVERGSSERKREYHVMKTQEGVVARERESLKEVEA